MRVQPKQGPLWFLNSRVEILVSGIDNPDAVSLMRHDIPFGDSPPLHVHKTESEVFHILQGRCRFLVGDHEYDLRAGQTLVAPPGIAHTYCVDSRDGVRCLTLTNTGEFERFVLAISRPAGPEFLPPQATPSPEEIARMSEACRPHNIEIVGPPLMAVSAAEEGPVGG